MAKTARLKLWLQIAQLKVWQDGMVSLAYAWWANVWMWIYALHAPGKKMKKKQTWSFHTHLLTPFSNTWHIHNAALAIVPFSWPTTICDAFTALYVCVSSNCSKWLRGSSKKRMKDWGGGGGLVLVHSCWPTCNAISAAGQSPSGGVSPCMVLFLDDIFTYHPYHPSPPHPIPHTRVHILNVLFVPVPNIFGATFSLYSADRTFVLLKNHFMP